MNVKLNVISCDVSNDLQLEFLQAQPDGIVQIVQKERGQNNCKVLMNIDPNELISLANMYYYIKANDIKNDFINPGGSKKTSKLGGL